MRVATVRRPSMAAFLAGLTLVATLSMVKVDRLITFDSDTVVAGTWGSPAEAFGRGKGPDGRESGPRSFVSDQDGHILVADTFNARVKEYDGRGRLLRQFAVGEGLARKSFIEDLAVTPAGHIYVADNANGVVLKYDRDGRLLATLDPRPELRRGDSWRVEALAAGPADGLYVLGLVLGVDGYAGSVRSFSASGALRAVTTEVCLDVTGQPRGNRAAAVDRLISGFAPAAAGQLVLLAAGDTPFQRTLFLVSGNGGEARRLLYESAVYIEDAALLGADSAGAVYLGANLTTARGWVAKLDADGRVLDSIEAGAPEAARGGPAALFGARVAPGGDLFLARPTADRFTIVRLSPQRHLGFRLRWQGASGQR
ncbi:MAG: hypothetical protein ACYC41_00825 [Bacillota bacterium]